MLHYHKIMQYVWLVVSALLLVITTFFGFQEGFDKWWMMYLFFLLTGMQYFRHKIQFKKMSPTKEENNANKQHAENL